MSKTVVRRALVVVVVDCASGSEARAFTDALVGRADVVGFSGAVSRRSDVRVALTRAATCLVTIIDDPRRVPCAYLSPTHMARVARDALVLVVDRATIAARRRLTRAWARAALAARPRVTVVLVVDDGNSGGDARELDVRELGAELGTVATHAYAVAVEDRRAARACWRHVLMAAWHRAST